MRVQWKPNPTVCGRPLWGPMGGVWLWAEVGVTEGIRPSLFPVEFPAWQWL